MTADDKNIPELTRKSITKLIAEEDVSAILLFSGSSSALEAADMAEFYQTPIIAVVASHPDVAKNNWIVQFNTDVTVQGTVAALFVFDELLIDRVAVFRNTDDEYSSNLAEIFSSKFREAGGTVESVAMEEIQSDYSQILERLKISGVNFFFLPLEAEQILNIEKAVREIDWNPMIMAGEGLLIRILLQFGDELSLVNGLLAPNVYSSDLPKTGIWSTSNGNLQEIIPGARNHIRRDWM